MPRCSPSGSGAGCAFWRPGLPQDPKAGRTQHARHCQRRDRTRGFSEQSEGPGNYGPGDSDRAALQAGSQPSFRP